MKDGQTPGPLPLTQCPEDDLLPSAFGEANQQVEALYLPERQHRYHLCDARFRTRAAQGWCPRPYILLSVHPVHLANVPTPLRCWPCPRVPILFTRHPGHSALAGSVPAYSCMETHTGLWLGKAGAL